MRNFRNLDIWKIGIDLVKDVYKLTEVLPKDEQYGLKSQITRAVVSIPSNIAEGSSRNSELEFKSFLEIAMGSAFELETQLLIIEDLDLCPSDEIHSVKEKLQIEQKMINKLISTIKKIILLEWF